MNYKTARTEYLLNLITLIVTTESISILAIAVAYITQTQAITILTIFITQISILIHIYNDYKKWRKKYGL